MSRKGLNKTEQDLYNSWDYIRKVAFREKCSIYEGVPCQWQTFEEFVKG